MNVTLDDTRKLISTAHSGQLYGNFPYTHHCELVLQECGEVDEYTKHIALMHDLLEDTHITAEILLKMGYPLIEVVNPITLVSRFDRSIPYLSWVKSIKDSGDFRAIIVKKADNMVNLKNVHTLPIEKQSIARRYERSLAILNG